MRTIKTFATLPVSKAVYDEIAGKLRAAGYNHAFLITGNYKGLTLDDAFAQGKVSINMDGISLVVDPDDYEHCVICDRPGSKQRDGQVICMDCASTPIEPNIEVKENFGNRDKNYLVTEEDIEDIEF